MSQLFEVDGDGSIVLSVYMQPGAARSGIVGRHGGALKVRVSAPAEAGRANAALVGLVARELGLRPSGIDVVAGATSRHKRLRLRDIDAEAVRRWLEVAAPA